MRDEIQASEKFWNDKHKIHAISSIKTDDWLDSYRTILSNATGLILDLGCGVGNGILCLKDKMDKIVACDQSINAIDNIKKNFPDIREALCFNMLDGFDFADSSFEVVIADLSLHYFREADTVRILNEIKRILEPGGFLIARVNSTNDTNFGAGEGEEIEPHLYRTSDGMFKRFFSSEDILKFFSMFNILSSEEKQMDRYRLPKMTYCILAQKGK